MKRNIFVLVFLLQTSLVFGQSSNSIYSWYSPQEKHYNKYLIGYQSYDIFDMEQVSVSRVEAEQVYFDSLLIDTQWLFNYQLFYPNSSFEKENWSFDRFQNRTNISIDKAVSIEAGKSLHNQINDPGLNVSSDIQTPNVEYVKKSNFISTKWNSSNYFFLLTFDQLDYSRTNALVYDRKVVNRLLARTRYYDNETFLLQRNTLDNLTLYGVYNQRGIRLKAFSSISNAEAFVWSPKVGIELPVSIQKRQISTSVSFAKGISLNTLVSFSTSSSLYEEISAPIDLEANLFHHELSLKFLPQLTIKPFYKVNEWNHRVADETAKIKDYGFATDFSANSSSKISFLLSNLDNYIKASYKINSSKFTFSQRSYSKKKNGFNLDTFNSPIAVIDTTYKKNQLKNNSSFLYQFSKIGLQSSIFDTPKLNLDLDLSFTHYWNYVDRSISYTYTSYSSPYISDINFSDTKNLGITDLYGSLKYGLTENFNATLSISSEIILYGDSNNKRLSKSIYSILASQNLYYSLSELSSIELYYRYTPQRFIEDFKPIQNDGKWPNSRVRPIHLLNFSFRTLLINQSFELTVSLRNLLNSTESYNTNGQYYNMSMMATGKIYIRK